MPARVYVGVGSNSNGRQNIQRGLQALRARFGDLIISPIYESEPVGLAGQNFFNLVIGFDTSATCAAIAVDLHEIEAGFGRSSGDGHLFSRALDLDLLLYGDLVVDGPDLQLPRPDVLKYAFVLKPLADVAGDHVHPITGRTYRDLWNTCAWHGQRLWPVDLETC